MYHDPLVRDAFAIAVERHAGQRYGSNQPFMSHLLNVVTVGRQFGYADERHELWDRDITAALWLHDVIEDTSLTYSELKNMTNFRVAELVYLVSDEKGRNRKERKEKTLAALKGNEDAIVVKLCDRIANIEYTVSDKNNNSHWGMYQKEHSHFVQILFDNNHTKCKSLWSRLDRTMQKGLRQ